MRKVIRLTALALVFVMMVAVLASCGSTPAKDPGKAVENLKKNGYVAEKLDGAEVKLLAGFGLKDITAMVTGFSTDEKDIIAIYYFETADAAKEAFKNVEEMIKEEKGESEFVIKQSGSMIYGGTKNAVKAAA